MTWMFLKIQNHDSKNQYVTYIVSFMSQNDSWVDQHATVLSITTLKETVNASVGTLPRPVSFEVKKFTEDPQCNMVDYTEAIFNRHWSKHTFRDIPKVQYAFKSLSAHGILQFTMLIALRCTLHRWSNRDIHHWKLYTLKWSIKNVRV